MLVSTYKSGAARWNADPVATGLVETRPIAAGTVASYRLQEAAPGGASTPTEGLTTRRHILLMATSDPTALTSCLVGVRGDLANPAGVPNPEKARDEANTYKRLLSGLIRGEITVPEEPARLAIEAIAVETDRENEYTRVVAEHDALRWLLTHLGARR